MDEVKVGAGDAVVARRQRPEAGTVGDHHLSGLGGIEVCAYPVFQAVRLSCWAGRFGAVSRSPMKRALAGPLANQPNPSLSAMVCGY